MNGPLSPETATAGRAAITRDCNYRQANSTRDSSAGWGAITRDCSSGWANSTKVQQQGAGELPQETATTHRPIASGTAVRDRALSPDQHKVIRHVRLLEVRPRGGYSAFLDTITSTYTYTYVHLSAYTHTHTCTHDLIHNATTWVRWQLPA